MIRARRPALLLPILIALLTLAVGCSTVSGGVQKPQNPPSGATLFDSNSGLRSVTASLDETTLPEEVLAEARQFTVAERIRRQVGGTAGVGQGDLSVDVKLIGMRLRGTGTAVWWGVMAGVDWMTVDVTVTRNGAQVKQFQTGVSTFLGGFVFGGREVRVDRMVDELARRIIAGI